MGCGFSLSSSIPCRCNSEMELQFADSELPDATRDFNLAEDK